MTQSEYKGFTIQVENAGLFVICHIVKPDGGNWCKYLSESIYTAYNRAFEAIDSDAGRAIITGMEVTKTRTLQVGDIVAVRSYAPVPSSIAIIESIRGKEYRVYHVEMVKGFYQKRTTVDTYQLENLALDPNRERWVKIKRDLDRRQDGEILQAWIENL